ncbi:MAG: hydroxysqualene dehydroxylase [Candidatus Kapaibacteriales bacterium]
MKKFEVVIVGGGIAGLTLSVELLKRNIEHVLIEAKKRIGGRFFSFVDPQTKSTIDNGQHLLSGAYTNFLELLDFLGTKEKLYYQNGLEVPFLSQNGKLYRFKVSKKGSKNSFINALLSFRILPFVSRLKILRLLAKIEKISLKSLNGVSLRDFLKLNNQDDNSINYFWLPLALAVMNNSLENIPSSVFLQTFQTGFYNDLRNSYLIFPKVGLSELLSPYYSIAESNNSVHLLLNQRVKRIEHKNSHFGLILNDGEIIYCQTLFLCIPPNHLSFIIPQEWKNLRYFKFLDLVSFNPIVSSYFWFTEEILDEYFCALSGSEIHWMFNRNKIEGISTNPFYLYAFTTSNGWSLLKINESNIVELVLSELGLRLGNKIPQPFHYRIFKDKFATVNINSGFEDMRPIQLTPIPRLFIAGDWTQTALPATIESACRSSLQAFNLFWEQING